MSFQSVKEIFSNYKKLFSRGIMCFVTFAVKASKLVIHLCIYFVWMMKNRSIKLCLSIGESVFYSGTVKSYTGQRSAERRPFSPGIPVFLRKECWQSSHRIIKIWLTLRNLSNQRPVKRGKLKRIQNSLSSFLKRTKHLFVSINCMFLSHIFSL